MNREHDNQDDADVVRRLSALPRTTPIDPDGADRVLAQLRRDGFLRPRKRVIHWGIRAAAAILLFTLGAFAGTRYAAARSLDKMLLRSDLPASQRVLLLQRAGSDYVRAAELYAERAQPADSGAAEVARRVLLGAAGAVARASVETDLSTRLARLLAPADRQPVIWF